MFQCWAFALVLLALSNVAEANSSLFNKYGSKTLHKQNDAFLEGMLGSDAFRNAGSDEETSGSRRFLLGGGDDLTSFDVDYNDYGKRCMDPALECVEKKCDWGEHNKFSGDCPAFKKKTDSWCDICGEPLCCAPTHDGCCDTDGGAVMGLVFGLMLLVAVITTFAYYSKYRCFCSRAQVITGATMQLPTVVRQPISVVAHGTPVQHQTSIQMSETISTFCPKCGAALSGAAFCPSCGQKQ